jgi:hypothetical protein
MRSPGSARTSANTRQQAVEFLLDHRVALADARFQARPVEHRDVAAVVSDQAGLLHVAGGLGDALAAHAEHVGDQFLGHDQFVGGQAVEAQQQPAAELLVERMMPVAHRRLRHLGQQGLGVAQQQMLHRARRG